MPNLLPDKQLAMPASPAYLTPFDSSKLENKTRAAVEALEAEFDVNAELLSKILDQFLWEFNEGLSKQAGDHDRDTYLPMM